MKYEEITCKDPLNKISSPYLPYNYDLNIYRGCEHGCKYCFARYSHSYISKADFFGNILVKTNIAEQLEKKLSSPSLKNKRINISGVSDCYQSCEKRYGLMREVLKVLIRYKNPVSITTKSDLILRDTDLIEELASLTSVTISASVITTDEALAAKAEPAAAPIQKRLDMLKIIKNTGAETAVFIMPIIPFLTDSLQNLESIFTAAQDLGASAVITDPLNLKGSTKPDFLRFIKEEYPHLFLPLLHLYKMPFPPPDYLEALSKTLDALRQKYPLAPSKIPKNKNYEQLTLF